MVRIWVLLVIMIFTSCSNDIPEPVSSADSYGNNFNISPVSKVSSDQQAVDSIFWPEIIGTSTFRFETCIKDFAANLDLPDSVFNITSGQKTITAATEATNGCLTWHYPLKFDFFKEETFYELPIEIEGVDKVKGKKQRRIAINPWNQSIRDIRNIEVEKSIPKLIPLDQSTEQADLGKLIIKDFDFSKNKSKKFIQVNNSQYVKLTYNLNFTPYLTRVGINSDIVPISLSKGKYQIKLTLMERDSLDNQLYSVSRGSDILFGRQGKVTTSLEMLHDSKRYNNTENETLLMVELKTQGLPGGEKVFKGVVPMQGIAQSRKDIPDQNEYDFIQAEVQSSAIKNLPEETEIQLLSNTDSSQLQFLLNRIEMSDMGDDNTVQLGDTSEKIRVFKVIGQLLNPLSGTQEPIKDGLYHLQVQSDAPYIQVHNPVQELQLDPNGLYVGLIKIPYNVYEKEKYYDLELVFSAQEGQWKGSTSSKKIKCNVVIHTCYLANEALELKTVANPELFVESVKYHTHLIDTDSYMVNHNMNLGFNSQYTFEIPQLKFRRLQREGSLPEAVTLGEYEIEVLIYSPKVSEPDEENLKFSEYFFLTGGRTRAEVSSVGGLNFNIKFPYLISERIYNNYRNLAIITIRPTDIHSPLRATTVTLPFYARQSSGAHLAAKQFEGALPEELYSEHVLKTLEEGVLYKIKKVNKMSSQSSVQTYRSMLDREKLITLNKNEFNQKVAANFKLRTSDFDSASESLEHKKTEDILTKFCHYKYQKGDPKIKECILKPKNFFKLTPTFHIEGIQDYKTADVSKDAIARGTYVSKTSGTIHKGQSYFAGSGVSRYQATGKTDSKTEEFATSLSFEMRIPLYFTTKKSQAQAHSIYKTTVENQTQMSLNRDFTTLAQRFEYEKLTLELLTDVIKCLKVYNDEVIYHVCNTLPQPYTVSESWYYVGPSRPTTEGIITDSSFRPTDGLVQIIRGNYNFMNQWEQYLKENNSYVIRANDSIDISEGLLKFQEDEKYESMPSENLLDNSFPGLYIPCKVSLKN